MDIVDVLQSEYQKRRAKNGRYSLRAFAQQMGVQSATLSAVLKRKRALPTAQTLRLMTQLKLSSQQKKVILKSMKTPMKESALHDFWARPEFRVEEATAAVVSEWEYAAVISLCKVKNFKPDERWIAKRLGIDVSRARQVWHDLRALRLVQVDANGKALVCLENFRISTPVPSAALREAHRKELNLALNKLETVPMAKRNYTSLTLAMSEKKLPEAVDLIRKFIQQMETTCEKGVLDSVYQLGIQLYPLTVLENEA